MKVCLRGMEDKIGVDVIHTLRIRGTKISNTNVDEKQKRTNQSHHTFMNYI